MFSYVRFNRVLDENTKVEVDFYSVYPLDRYNPNPDDADKYDALSGRLDDEDDVLGFLSKYHRNSKQSYHSIYAVFNFLHNYILGQYGPREYQYPRTFHHRNQHELELFKEMMMEPPRIAYDGPIIVANRICAHCEAPAPQFQCGACAIPYCGRQCQREHWTSGGHEQECEDTNL